MSMSWEPRKHGQCESFSQGALYVPCLRYIGHEEPHRGIQDDGLLVEWWSDYQNDNLPCYTTIDSSSVYHKEGCVPIRDAGFHMEVNSVDDLSVLATLLRGKDLDKAQLLELADILRVGRTEQGGVVDADKSQEGEEGRHGFRIEITSIKEFAAFCMLIRGGKLDDATLKELTGGLRKSTKVLGDAIDADSGKKP